MLGTVIQLFIPAYVHLYTDKPAGDLLWTNLRVVDNSEEETIAREAASNENEEENTMEKEEKVIPVSESVVVPDYRWRKIKHLRRNKAVFRTGKLQYITMQYITMIQLFVEI